MKDIKDSGKRWLEELLGQRLREDQQVFIMVLSPGSEPGEEARRRARADLEATFRRTEAYAQKHGITGPEVDAAIEEAMQDVRPRTD